MDVNIKTESEESGNENETNDVMHNTKDIRDPFLCEFCDCGIQTKYFQHREELITHTLKYHPKVCLGCFEMFASSEDLLQHLKISFHESMVCRACCRDFGSRLAMLLHYCQNVPSLPQKDLKFDSSAPRKVVNETFEMVEKRSVENEPMNIVDESGEDFSSESEDDIEEKHVLEKDSEGDSSESSDDDNKVLFNVSGVKDVVLDCMHCSFVVQGTESVPSLHGLRVHIITDHPNVCAFCFEGFDDAENLVEHQESMKHKIWGCVSCKHVFMRTGGYQLHMAKKHPDQCQFQCPECPARFFSTNQIPSHVRSCHRNVTKNKIKLIPRNICGLCDYATSSTFAHIMHMIEMHSESNQMPIFNCNVCQFGFNRPHDFSKHIADKHFEDFEFQNIFNELSDIYTLRFECEPCVKIYTNRSRYLRHLRVVHPSSMAHQCSFCGWRFLDPNDLRLHESTDHTKALPYACDGCKHSFTSFDKFLHHLKKAHKRTSLPTFIYCFAHKKKFVCYRNALLHFQNVHDSKTKTKELFTCEQCGKVLSSQFVLDQHILDHQPDRPFKCETCGKRYSSSFRLKCHKASHQAKFSCETCGKTFSFERSLKRHMIVHTGEKPFECSICGLRVSQDSALKRHKDKVHPGGIMGKRLSTKPRKCRVLAKTLCEKDNATLPVKDGKVDAMFRKVSDKQTSQPQADSHPARKRRPTTASSESGSVQLRRDVKSPEPSLDMASGKAKRQTTTAPLTRRRKGRRSRKSSYPFQSSSSGEDEADFWESSNDDEVYVPQTKCLAIDSGECRRSLRLRKL